MRSISNKFKMLDESEIIYPHDKVLYYFINGGKIDKSAVKEIYGKRKKIKKQIRSMNGLTRDSGPTIDGLAHHMWEEDETQKFDTSDYKDAIEQVLISYNSSSGMAKDLLQRYNRVEVVQLPVIDKHHENKLNKIILLVDELVSQGNKIYISYFPIKEKPNIEFKFKEKISELLIPHIYEAAKQYGKKITIISRIEPVKAKISTQDIPGWKPFLGEAF